MKVITNDGTYYDDVPNQIDDKALNSKPYFYDDYVGPDAFNYSYDGDDSETTEINPLLFEEARTFSTPQQIVKVKDGEFDQICIHFMKLMYNFQEEDRNHHVGDMIGKMRTFDKLLEKCTNKSVSGLMRFYDNNETRNRIKKKAQSLFPSHYGFKGIVTDSDVAKSIQYFTEAMDSDDRLEWFYSKFPDVRNR